MRGQSYPAGAGSSFEAWMIGMDDQAAHNHEARLSSCCSLPTMFKQSCVEEMEH